MSSSTLKGISYWEKTSFLHDRDVVIIGGGLVGLCTALMLKDRCPDCSILLIEKNSIPLGASTRNAGFACFGSPSELVADSKKMGWDTTFELVKMRWQGLEKLKKLVNGRKIDFEAPGGYEVYRADDEEIFEECLHSLDQINEATSFDDNPSFSLGTEGDRARLGLSAFKHLICCHREGALNPGKLIRTLSSMAGKKNVQLLTGVGVTQIHDRGKQVELTLDNGQWIRAVKTVVATNAFASRLVEGLDLIPARNQVIVTTPIRNLKINGTFHCDQGFLYFRDIEDRLLLGGGRNHFMTEETTDQFGTSEKVIQYLLNFMREYILVDQSCAIEYQWSGIIGTGSSKQPLLHWHSPGIFLACRMGGMGISIGAAVAEKAAREISSQLISR